MKKILLSLTFICCAAVLVFIACSKKDTKLQHETIVRKDPVIFFGTLSPSWIKQSNDTIVTVSFMQSAALFELDTRLVNSSQYAKLLQDALEQKIPVQVKVFEGTVEIAEVTPASKEDVEKFKNSISKESKATTKESLPIIPSESALNSLFNNVNSPAIPFRYAADGCYARAHKMRQIIIASGYDCAKVFIYGYLGANTGSCCAKWGWHVAPLVRFRNAAGLVELRILDPSLFNRPATQEEWKKKCEDVYCRPGASVDASATTYGNVYYRDATGWVTYDDNYSKTNCTISYYNQYQGCTFMPTPPCGL